MGWSGAARFFFATWAVVSSATAAWEVRSTRGVVRADRDGVPALVYRCVPAPKKPYVQQLYTPGGLAILRDAPPDHVHHHGLMFAVGADGVDFWIETNSAKIGTQVPRARKDQDSVVTIQKDPHRLVLQQTIDWLDPDGKGVLEENRRIVLHRLADRSVTLQTWTSRLRPAINRSSVRLWGRHYFGLGMRFAATPEKEVVFRNAAGAEGEPVRGTEKLVSAAWCACTLWVAGQQTTVAMFGLPTPSEKAFTWFTMTRPFAYLSATRRLHQRPIVLQRGRPLDWTCGIAVWDGKPREEEINRVYRKWIALQKDDPPKPRPKEETPP